MNVSDPITDVKPSVKAVCEEHCQSIANVGEQFIELVKNFKKEHKDADKWVLKGVIADLITPVFVKLYRIGESINFDLRQRIPYITQRRS